MMDLYFGSGWFFFLLAHERGRGRGEGGEGGSEKVPERESVCVFKGGGGSWGRENGRGGWPLFASLLLLLSLSHSLLLFFSPSLLLSFSPLSLLSSSLSLSLPLFLFLSFLSSLYYLLKKAFGGQLSQWAMPVELILHDSLIFFKCFSFLFSFSFFFSFFLFFFFFF